MTGASLENKTENTNNQRELLLTAEGAATRTSGQLDKLLVSFMRRKYGKDSIEHVQALGYEVEKDSRVILSHISGGRSTFSTMISLCKKNLAW